MNGYTSINMGGKTRGIKFGNRALLDVMAKHGFGTNFKFSFDLVVDLVYFGLHNNCLIKKETVDFTLTEVTEWVDDIPMPELVALFTLFQQSYSGEQDKTKTKSTPKN